MASVTGSVIRVDEQELRGHLDNVVRASVEETLNTMLDAEADRPCHAKRYERTADRVDTRAGSYERKLVTKAGEVKLKVPRLRSLPFEMQDQRCASVPLSVIAGENRRLSDGRGSADSAFVNGDQLRWRVFANAGESFDTSKTARRFRAAGFRVPNCIKWA